jgi:hypothetical protein
MLTTEQHIHITQYRLEDAPLKAPSTSTHTTTTTTAAAHTQRFGQLIGEVILHIERDVVLQHEQGIFRTLPRLHILGALVASEK